MCINYLIPKRPGASFIIIAYAQNGASYKKVEIYKNKLDRRMCTSDPGVRTFWRQEIGDALVEVVNCSQIVS